MAGPDQRQKMTPTVVFSLLEKAERGTGGMGASCTDWAHSTRPHKVSCPMPVSGTAGVCRDETQHQRGFQQTFHAHLWPGACQILASCWLRLSVVCVDSIRNKPFVSSFLFSTRVTARFQL